MSKTRKNGCYKFQLMLLNGLFLSEQQMFDLQTNKLEKSKNSSNLTQKKD